MIVVSSSVRAQCTNPAGVAGEEFYNFSEKVFQYCNGDDWVAMICNNEPDIEPADCSLPWGGTILHNANVTAYQNATEPFGGSCVTESRVCNNGALSGSYTNQNCSVLPPADCTAPWGATVSHSSDVIAYQNATEPFGGSCTSESRTCNNGALDGSYTNQTCTVDSGDPCNGSPAPGVICADGTVYAGLSPNGNIKMYTTPSDAGIFPWNGSIQIHGSPNYIDTAMANCNTSETTCTTGESNTTLLASLGSSPSPAPYLAALHCSNLVAHGRTDWYLPSRDELQVMRVNRISIGSFNLTGSLYSGFYLSSSEKDLYNIWSIRFSDGAVSTGLSKTTPISARCVRR
jgi:hypothetical protein